MAFQGEKAFWQRIESRTGIKNPDQQRDEEQGVPGKTAFWKALGMKEPEDSIDERSRRIRTERILAEHRNVGYQEFKENAEEETAEKEETAVKNQIRLGELLMGSGKDYQDSMGKINQAGKIATKSLLGSLFGTKGGEESEGSATNHSRSLSTSMTEEQDSLDQQLRDLANAKVEDEYAGKVKGIMEQDGRSLYGQEGSDSYDQDLQAAQQKAENGKDAQEPVTEKDQDAAYFAGLLGKGNWTQQAENSTGAGNAAGSTESAAEEKQRVDQEVEALRQQRDKLKQQQAGFGRSFTISQEQKEQVDAQLEEVQAALKDAEARQAELEWAKNLEERKATLTAYEQYRENADFQTVAEKAQNTEYSRQEDPLGYYLDNREMLDAMADIDYSSDNWKNWGELSKPEIQMYYYLLGSQGKKAAQEYLDDIQIVLDQRAYATAQGIVTDLYQGANLAGKIGLNVVGATANAVGGIPAVAGDVASALSGKGYNPYNQGHSLLDFSNAVQSATSEDIKYQLLDDETKALLEEYNELVDQDAKMAFSGSETQAEYAKRQERIAEVSAALQEKQQGFDWGNFWANTYQAVYSGGSSAVGAMMFNKGYTAVMGASAASQRARELWENGASAEQIGIGAVASGLIEMATEKYSVEYFTQNFLAGNIQGPKDWLVKTLVQGFNEGSEEVASEVANQVANALILAGNSDNQREIRALMEDGMSREEAEKQALINRAVDIFWAGYGGFVSGGTMGGIGGPVNTFTNHVLTGKGVMQNNAGQELVQAAEDSGVNEQVRQLAMEKASGDYEAMNAWQRMQAEKEMGKLYEQTMQAQEEQAKQAVRDSFQRVAEDKVREAHEAEQNQEDTGTQQEEPKTAAEEIWRRDPFKEVEERLKNEKNESELNNGSSGSEEQVVGDLNDPEYLRWLFREPEEPVSIPKKETEDKNESQLKNDSFWEETEISDVNDPKYISWLFRHSEEPVTIQKNGTEDKKGNPVPKEDDTKQLRDLFRESEKPAQSEKNDSKIDAGKAAEALTKAAYGEALTDAEKKTVEAVGGEVLIEEIANSREFREDAAAKVEDANRRMADTMAMTQDTSKQKEIVSRFARENGMDEAVMLGSIRRSQDAYKFTNAWQIAYDIGKGDIALRYAQKSSASRYLTQAQIETAYNEGRKAAGYYEAAEEGPVSDGGQWNDRAYSGGQVRSVESGAAAQGQSGQQGAGGGLAAAAEKITSIQLGLENGTENRNLRRVAEAAYSEDTKAAAKVAKDSGLVFVPFSGGAIETWETVNGQKIKVKSRGCVVNGTMYVRVDDNTFTAEQIARHEAAHEQINRGEIDVEDARQRLLERYSPEEIEAIIQLYASAYGDSGLTAEQVMEEIVCDAMGRMNAFATDATERVAGEVGVFLRNVRKAANAAKVETKKSAVPNTESGSVKHSIVETEDGRMVAVVDNDILANIDTNSWDKSKIEQAKSAARHALSQFSDGIAVNGITRKVNKVSKKEFTRSKYTQHLANTDTGIFADKMRMADIADDVVAVTSGWGRDGRLVHPRNDNFVDFDHGTALVMAGENKYQTEVIVGITNRGEYVFYDVTNIYPVSYKIMEESHTNATTDKPIGAVNRDSSKEMVSQRGEKVKQKYSREMDTVKALERQKKLLQEQRDYWKDQTRLTKTAKADKDAVRKLGREILREYSSSIKVDEILTDLQWLADDAVGKGNASYQEMTDAAEKIARKVLEGSGVDLNGDLAEIRKELKQYLRSTPINITESIKAGIPDFADFKKRNRALHFREDGSGTNVDEMWLELQDQFGTGMFPEKITNQEDQVRYIAEELEDIREVMVNPYGKEMELAVQQLTYDILYRTSAETQQMKPTKADQAVERATKEMQQLLAEGRRRENARIENAQKTSIRQQIRTISDKFQSMATRPGKGISQHAPEGLRKAVVDFCGVFTESELRRMDRWQRNLEYRADELGRKASNVDVATGVVAEAEAIQNAQARRDRMTARLTKLQNAYAAMKKDGQYQTTYDETVAEMIKNLSEILDGKDLYQLETGDLRRVQQTMSAIYYTITNANKAFSMGKDKSIIDMATKIAREIRQTNPNQAGMMVAGKRFLQWQMSPDTFFNYICGYIKNNEGKVIQKGFQQGAERMMGVQREFYQMFRAFTESKDKAVHKELSDLMNYSSKRMVNWGMKDLEGNEVKTTRGMMIQAYMLLNQKDSFESLQYGGFSIPNAERYYKGDIAGAYGDALETTMLSESIGTGYTEMIQRNKDLRSRIDELQQKVEEAAGEKIGQKYQDEIRQLEEQIRENQQKMEAITSAAAERLYNLQNAIEKQLTPLEKQLIEKAHEWYSYSGKLMADVFEQMYGFRPNLVGNYVPIHRDPTTIKTDIRDMAGAEKAFNLENSGFTIDRVKNSQPILLTDFFQELNSQSEKMARYVGFAQVQKDFGKIWKTRIDSSGMTVNTLVRARFGAGKTNLGVSGEEYINHYIADVAGGHSSDDVLGKFYGNYAAATLRLNPRVAISQAASIPTAASVVGWKSMAAGFAKGLPKAMSTKYRNGLAEKNVWFYQRYRGQGGSTELAEIRQKGNVIERVANSRVGKKLFNWCQAVDVFSTGSIMWSAAEDYVKSQGIAKGSAEYEAAVNQVYTDIIRKSQPNYTTTERSDMLRDQRAHMKLLTMFKTQSNQNLNLLLEANGEFIRMKQDLKNGRNGVTDADVKAAGKKLANASTGVLLGGTVAFVGLRTIMNFILGAVYPYRDDETDEVTLESTLAGMGKEILSSLAGTVALGGQVYDFLMPLITGDTYYGLSDSAVSSLSSMLENTITVIQKGKDTTGTQMWKMVNSWCMALGIPAGNAKKIYDMIDMYTRDIQNGTFGQFTSDKTTKSKYQARVVEHYLKGEEEEAADALAMLFAKSSADTDDEAKKEIASGMRSYLKNLYIQGEVSDVEAEKLMEYTGTDEPASYTAKWDFQLAYPEINASDALVKAYGEKGSISDEVFLDAWEFAKNAEADKDKEGKSISGSKKQKIVDYVQAIPGLTKSQRKKLFELLDAGSVKGTPWE